MAEQRGSGMFKGPEEGRSGFSWQAVAVAAGVIVLAVLIASFAGLLHRAPAVSTTRDTYAGQLPLSEVALSEATSGAGGRSTYVDGVVTNTGQETVRGITVRCRFAMSDGGSPRVEVMPLSLIRTREPYVDLQPVSATPLQPGTSREFRLILEGLPEGWDKQAPQITIVQTTR